MTNVKDIHSGLNEVSFVSDLLSSSQQLSAFFASNFDESQNLLELHVVNLWTLSCIGVLRRADHSFSSQCY